MRILEKYRQIQLAYSESIVNIWNKNDFVFTLYNGEPVGGNRMYKWFRRFCEENGLPFKGIHVGRHQIASMMLDNGISIPEIANHLGHSSPSTTLAIYSHEVKLAEAKKRNMDKISEMLGISDNLVKSKVVGGNDTENDEQEEKFGT
jgi:integrase